MNENDTIWVRAKFEEYDNHGDMKYRTRCNNGRLSWGYVSAADVRTLTNSEKIAEMRQEVARMKIEIERLENEG